jgi:hypothetical protein
VDLSFKREVRAFCILERDKVRLVIGMVKKHTVFFYDLEIVKQKKNIETILPYETGYFL